MDTSEYKDKFLTPEQEEELAQGMAAINSPEYNSLKLVEECLEASINLVKTITKSPGNQPSEAEVVEECGDVVARMLLFAHQRGVVEQVTERAQQS